jgi:Tetratricopeptide repeat/Protein of unknown function (DUF2914)
MTMPQLSHAPDVRNMLAEAEHAASAGDLVSAEARLRDAARLQETEHGPFHPDLANTLNNLAIVAEKQGRPRDAETFYRRAVEIASASLPPDDPMVDASRQNLEDFCHAHGLPIEKPAVIQPAGAQAPSRSTRAPAPSSPARSRNASRQAPAIAIGIVAVVIAAFLIGLPRPPRGESTTAPAAEPAPAPAAEPARPAPGVRAPIERTPSSMPRVDTAPAPGAIALATVQLCRSFSRSGWRCVPAGDSVAPGRMVLYTRVRSPRGGVISHRWYQGDALRRSADLKIGASAAEGYRTYSGQTVDRGDWRVEVRGARGELLHEQRFAVR